MQKNKTISAETNNYAENNTTQKYIRCAENDQISNRIINSFASLFDRNCFFSVFDIKKIIIMEAIEYY